MVFNNNLLLGAAGAGGDYSINQSIRFNDDDSAYLEWSGYSGSPTSGTDCTFSFWVKRCKLGATQVCIYGGDASGSTYEGIRFDSDDQFRVFQASSAYDIITSQVFRDVSAWSHFVVAFDTNNATASERIKIYHNGSRITDFSLQTNPSSGYVTNFNTGGAGEAIQVGREGGNSQFLDGYLAEINFVDGQALDPTSFGETNSDTGQWVPVSYTGSYGINGYYITGADSADLGADDSGNGNDFTSSGLTAADQMPDTPTDNFITWNPLVNPGGGSTGTFSNGNLDFTAGGDNGRAGTIFQSSGKWYVEWEIIGSGANCMVGIVSESVVASSDMVDNSASSGLDQYGGDRDVCSYYGTTGAIFLATTNPAYGDSYANGDIIGMALDLDNGAVWFSKNGTWQNSATISEIEAGTTTNAARTGLDNNFTLHFHQFDGTSGARINAGQAAFTYTQPTGFSKLSTANLDDPTIALPEKYFNTVLYEGNGGGQRVGQFQPITETYSVPNSVIFNDNDSPSLTWTPGADASSQTTFTISMWFKRGDLSNNGALIAGYGGSGATLDEIRFNSGDGKIYFRKANVNVLVTTQVLRDPSAWYHLVLAVDTNDATSGDRYKLYLNGVRITAFDTATYPSSGATFTGFTKNVAQYVGAAGAATGSFDGYLAEVIMIDGQSLGPDSFGQLDASTNKWIPKDASGLTFGTNGFYLDFESGKESTSGATTTNMNATQFVNGSMGSWGTGDTAYDFTGGTADRNINTGTSFIPSSTDFDFYGTLSAAASPNAPFLGWYNSGTNTNAGTPSTTASAGVYGRNGNSTGSSSGWLLLSGTREAERPNKSWEFQRKVGVHRRGSQLYGSLNGRIDHKYSSTPSTTSAGGLFLGNSGDGTSYTWSDVHSITYSSTTQNQYGLDSSGNGNNFTEEGTWDFLGGGNLSYDTPTRNSLGFWDGEFETGSTETDPEFGNTKINNNTGNNVGTPSRGFVSSGKWYYEIDVLAVYNGTGNSTYGVYGVVDYDSYGDTYDNTASGSLAYGGKVVGWKSDGAKVDESSQTASVFNTVSAGDVIQIALDMDNGAVWFGKNNTWELSATASEIENGDTSNAVRTGLTGEWSPVFHRWTLTERVEINAGSAFRFSNSELSLDTASGGYFKYTPPNGFKSLNNDNLPLSNGDLSAFVWIKNRDAADNHMLFDAVRGVTKDMHSNSNAAEVTNANTLTRFLKNGFEVSNDAEVNTSGESYVAWQWLNDSLTTSSNADGSITSTVLANTTSGFSTATYTGNATVGATVGHGLGVAPKMVIVKTNSGTENWVVGHDSMGWTKAMYLNSTSAQITLDIYWNNTAPTSSVVELHDHPVTNGSGYTYVMYSFAEVEGFSKFGSYTGNGSTDGPFVYTGFKPRFVMIKRYTSTESWPILDTARGSGTFGSDAGSGGDNPTAGNDLNAVLVASTTAAEEDNVGGSRRASYVSNGFKVRTTNTAMNASGSGYIYMAFAESPFKTATAR